MYKLNKKVIIIGTLFSLLSPIQFAYSETPAYDPVTSILILPLVASESDSSSATLWSQVQVRLDSIAVLGAEEVKKTFSDEIIMGAMAYSKYYETSAGGDGNKPEHADFTRCKACHGWDNLATAGGYVRRSGNETRSGAGNIRLDRTDYTADQILNGSWIPGTDTATSAHPNYAGLLSTEQANALVAYLNSEGAKFSAIGEVYNAPNPATYTIPYGDATRGESFYSSNCLSCHGAPAEDSALFPALKPAGGLLTMFNKDGKPSEIAHKAMWGEVGSFMTRASMGNPTTQDIADLLKYFQSL